MTDGTTGGTIPLTSLGPGSKISYPGNLTSVDGTLYFTATGANDQNELWQSDGTAQGTSLVADLTTEPWQPPSYNIGYTSGSSTWSSSRARGPGRNSVLR